MFWLSEVWRTGSSYSSSDWTRVSVELQVFRSPADTGSFQRSVHLSLGPDYYLGSCRLIMCGRSPWVSGRSCSPPPGTTPSPLPCCSGWPSRPSSGNGLWRRRSPSRPGSAPASRLREKKVSEPKSQRKLEELQLSFTSMCPPPPPPAPLMSSDWITQLALRLLRSEDTAGKVCECPWDYQCRWWRKERREEQWRRENPAYWLRWLLCPSDADLWFHPLTPSTAEMGQKRKSSHSAPAPGATDDW